MRLHETQTLRVPAGITTLLAILLLPIVGADLHTEDAKVLSVKFGQSLLHRSGLEIQSSVASQPPALHFQQARKNTSYTAIAIDQGIFISPEIYSITAPTDSSTLLYIQPSLRLESASATGAPRGTLLLPELGPLMPYSPAKPVENEPHVVLFLLFAQPVDMSIPVKDATLISNAVGSPAERAGFDLGAFVLHADLGSPLASSWFVVMPEQEVSGSGASSSSSGPSSSTRPYPSSETAGGLASSTTTRSGTGAAIAPTGGPAATTNTAFTAPSPVSSLRVSGLGSGRSTATGGSGAIIIGSVSLTASSSSAPTAGTRAASASPSDDEAMYEPAETGSSTSTSTSTSSACSSSSGGGGGGAHSSRTSAAVVFVTAATDGSTTTTSATTVAPALDSIVPIGTGAGSYSSSSDSPSPSGSAATTTLSLRLLSSSSSSGLSSGRQAGNSSSTPAVAVNAGVVTPGPAARGSAVAAPVSAAAGGRPRRGGSGVGVDAVVAGIVSLFVGIFLVW